MKGSWSGATAYTIGDIVTSAGSSYICITNHTNQTPPSVTYWALLASKGDVGPTGPQGDSAVITGGVQNNIVTISSSEEVQDSGLSVIDDDSMAGATATKLPTSESVKTYVDNRVASFLKLRSITQKDLAVGFSAAAGTAEQEVTGLAMTLPIIPGLTQATIEIRSVVFINTPAGNTNIRHRLGTSLTFSSNAELNSSYIDEAAKTPSLVTEEVITAVDLTVQQYLNFTIQNFTDATALSISAAGARSHFIVKIYEA